MSKIYVMSLQLSIDRHTQLPLVDFLRVKKKVGVIDR
jgi:hypothetical protein